MSVRPNSLSEVPAPDLRSHLHRELVRRCQVNPRYSLRAFARSLQLESSYLSKVLSGKRPVREWLVTKVETPLGLSPTIADRYRAIARGGPRKPLTFSPLERDAFAAIADWWHYAILELTSVDGFQAEPAWIARKLDLPSPLVSDALARLKRLGLLVEEAGRLRASEQHFTIRSGDSEAPLRRLQRGVLELALRALDEVPIAARDQASMTMAIPTALLPEAKRRLQRFRRQLCAFLQASPLPKDAVYHLSLSLYPVTRPDGL